MSVIRDLGTRYDRVLDFFDLNFSCRFLTILFVYKCVVVVVDALALTK